MRYDAAVLITQQVQEMTCFYVNVLKQKVRFDFGQCQILECGISIWEPGENDPAMKAPGIGQGMNSRLELCFDTEDFEGDVAQILAHQPRMLHGVEEQAWGQYTIRFFDPDGNLIEVGESIPCFCRRLYNEGMSFEQVSEKTGVSVEQVRAYVSSSADLSTYI